MQCARIIINKIANGDCVDRHCDVLLPIDVHDTGVKVEAIQCTAISKHSGSSIMKIVDPSGLNSDKLIFGPVKNKLGECEIMKVSKNNYIVIVTNNNCRLASIISESGCFLTSSVPHGPHESEWTIVGLNSEYIHNLIVRLKEVGYGVDVLSTNQMNMGPVLTSKQESYIRTAYEKGYYQVPKTVTLKDLEEEAGCSKSNLSVILRESERKIVTNYLEINRDSMNIGKNGKRN